MTRSRIVVGLSGGVDSAVAAWMLKQQGHDVVGLFMKNWADDDDDEYCSTRQDLIDAAAVADVIGIDLEAVNFAAEYRDRVFSAFLAEYGAGRTPNPDVLCNAEIKFKAFLDHAVRLGAERIATGHYARVDHGPDGTHRLLKGTDPSKDQSYFLHRLTQAQLSRALFPLGAMHKTEVRETAARLGLPNARKKDSTGICFIGERPFRAFLGRYLPTAPGPIRTPDVGGGAVVGEHVGLAFYTLGQRKGIGIGGVRDADEGAWFVARKDMATNTLWIVRGHDHPWLLSREVAVEDASWIAGRSPEARALHAKTRYRQRDEGCRIASGASGFTLSFDQLQRAVTPGQSAVVYDGDVCLGGGIIASAAADRMDRALPRMWGQSGVSPT